MSLILVISSQAVFAQLRMVSKEKLASVSDPRLSTDSAAMRFETRHIVADPMTEEDEPHPRKNSTAVKWSPCYS